MPSDVNTKLKGNVIVNVYLKKSRAVSARKKNAKGQQIALLNLKGTWKTNRKLKFTPNNTTCSTCINILVALTKQSMEKT